MNIWLLKMAWRDGRKNAGRLLLFTASIVLGIAALVGINSFGESLRGQIESEAKELLGADLEVSSRSPIPEKVLQRFDSLGFKSASEVSFASMVYFPKSGGTRLINVRAMAGEFPFYGKIETNPNRDQIYFDKAQKALVDQTLLMQFDAMPGESVKIGKLIFDIDASVLKVPGRSAISTTVAPPVFIPLNLLPETGLNELGSRMNYKLYAKYPSGFNPAEIEKSLRPWLESQELEVDDVNDRKDSVGNAYTDLTGFLNLTAFIALILGCVGVAGSVNIYMKEKLQSVAILRCLGASGVQAMSIYLIQVIAIGLVGSIIGAVLGASIQMLLPGLFAEFLPFEVGLKISWTSIIQGIVTGTVAALLFSLFPLIKIRKISPLKAIRASFENRETDRLSILIYLLILLFVIGFAWLQLDSIGQALIFTTGLLVAFALLAGTSALIIWLVRRFFPRNVSFILRQSLANLYRPNNQTLLLVVTIGLGTALISTLLISQDLLVNKLKFSASGANKPNMVLFDIQSGQIDSLRVLVQREGLPVISTVPIVTMRLEGIKGRSIGEIRSDSLNPVDERFLNREYRVSYRDAPSDSETLIKGTWPKAVKDNKDSIFISLEEGIATELHAALGDEIDFNVQGVMMKTYVSSIRKVDWQRMSTNFLVMFPTGVLEKAPKFHVLLTRFDSTAQSANFQKAVVTQFPNISIIDLELVLNTVDEVLGKVSFVIRFMAFFSVFTGLLVLIGSVLITKYQRIHESVLLRTLGALRHHVLRINALEYIFLGSLAALAGILISLLAGWLLAWLSFETAFRPDMPMLIIVYAAITSITLIIGLASSGGVFTKPPLEVLRRE